MKRFFFLFMILLSTAAIKAQEIDDALRYAVDDINGSARFVSMSGAFGALGGDMSALSINPASSSVFMANQASLSFDIDAYKNKTEYANGLNDYKNNSFDLNQAGAVFVFDNLNESADITKLSFGVSYDKKKSFDNRFSAVGNNNETIGDYFLNMAQGVPLDLLEPRSNESLDDLYDYLGYADEGFNNSRLQTAYLGYETYLFDEAKDDSKNTEYLSNVNGDSFDHVYRNYEKGLNGKLTFNGSLAIQDRFYFGLNLNSHFSDYQQTIILNEEIPEPSEINYIRFRNYLDTRGTGFSFQVGGIARIDDTWRVGASYESPTWYRISDETTQSLVSDSDEFGDAVANPHVTNVYPDYRMRTPGKFSGSLAAVIGGHGLISFDYSYKDFSKTKYSSSGFEDVNEDISNNLQAVNTYRLGGEYRLKALSFRAGVRYEDSPYEDKTIGDLQGYSAGLGYDFGGLRLDFAYDLAKRDYDTELLYTGFSERASIKNTLSNYILTVTFDL